MPGCHSDVVSLLSLQIDEVGAGGETDRLPVPLAEVVGFGHGVVDVVADHFGTEGNRLPPNLDGGVRSGHRPHFLGGAHNVAVSSKCHLKDALVRNCRSLNQFTISPICRLCRLKSISDKKLPYFDKKYQLRLDEPFFVAAL